MVGLNVWRFLSLLTEPFISGISGSLSKPIYDPAFTHLRSETANPGAKPACYALTAAARRGTSPPIDAMRAARNRDQTADSDKTGKRDAI
jgi:hypothetical protein